MTRYRADDAHVDQICGPIWSRCLAIRSCVARYAVWTWFTIAAALLPALAGCGETLSEQPFCADQQSPPTPTAAARTWYEHAAPIVLSRCAGCHEPDGIASFMPLDTLERVRGAAAVVRDAVAAGRMPPWLPVGCCGPRYLHDFSLSPTQRADLLAFLDQGAAAGDPADAVPTPAPMGGLSRVDVELAMPEPYPPTPSPGRLDDFRCFVLDWPHATQRFVTGIQPLPGARKALHHVVVAWVSDAVGGALRARRGT